MNSDWQNHSSTNLTMQKALLALCATTTLFLIGWLIKFSVYGIDFTDESFYLVWIANPFIYDASVTQFGFLYHPLYKLLSGDIGALRQANILITFALSWCLTYTSLAKLEAGLKENRITLLVVSSALATSSFILFDSWLPTPSYNSLNLQALLITSTGLVLSEKTVSLKSVFGWLLIGMGGWLTFMAKPSTSIALAIGVFVFLIVSRKFSFNLILITLFWTLTLVFASALMIDGSIAVFFKRIQLGLESAKYLGGGHNLSQIVRIDDFIIERKLQNAIVLFFGLISLALWSNFSINKNWSFIGLLISIGLFILTILITTGQMHGAAALGRFQGLLIFAIVYSLAFIAIALGGLRILRKISLEQWAMVTIFLSMPHIYAIGTNGNYWQAGGAAAVFWIVAGFVLLGPLIREHNSWLLVLPVALATQSVTAILVHTGLEQPYRQTQPLRFNASLTEFGPQKSKLVLSEGYSKYIDDVDLAISKAGFESTTPMIDLSGQSPGILYSIGAENIGQAWTIGGYPGSLKQAQMQLSRTPCGKISDAWILFEKDGPRSIQTELMHNLGADFPNSYIQAGTWKTAEGAGGYKERRTQEIFKPIDPSRTFITCQKLREAVNK